MKRLSRWFDQLIAKAVQERVDIRMRQIELMLDLQHGTRYSIYADSLQASVYRLKDHVDHVKDVAATEIMMLKDQVKLDRKMILDLRDRLGVTDEQMELGL